MARVAINGLGRIGRATFKILLDTPGMEVVAVNDIVPAENLAYLLKYDTVYGRYDKTVDWEEGALIVDGKRYPMLQEKNPEELPWSEMDVDIAFEATGVFTDRQGLRNHIEAGAKFAILSAPLGEKHEDAPMVVFGVNKPDVDEVQMISTASCTTNCISPVVEIVGRRLGLEKAVMTTVHAYTSSQSIVDSPKKKMRRGRAGAANFVPTTTGAAVATTKVLPQYEGKFDGVAVRGPVPCGSIADIILVTEQDTTAEEINQIFAEEAESDRYNGIFGVTEDEWVSSDVIGEPRASVVDTEMTVVVGGNLVKVMSWYDNEWGYSSQMVRAAVYVAEQMKERATA